MPARKHGKHITQKERFALTTALLENYTKSGLSDTDFAAQYRKQTGVEGVESHVIAYIRKEFEIPANRVVGDSGKNSPWRAQMEKRLEALEKRVEVYLTGSLK